MFLNTSSQHSFDGGSDLLWGHLRLVEFKHLTLLVDQELGPTPRDLLGSLVALQLCRMSSQELENFMRILAVHIDFLENGEFHSSLFLEQLELLFRSLFLVETI